MRDLEDSERRMKIRVLLAPLRGRPLPVAKEMSTIEEVIRAMTQIEHSRVFFVVNDHGQLRGTISLGVLVRQVFSREHAPEGRARFLIGMVTAERARDIMLPQPVYALESEEVGTVVDRMITSQVKEIPILDDEMRVVGDLTMIDLLKFLSTAQGP